MSANRPYVYRCKSCGTRNKIPADKLGKVGKCGKCGSALETRELLDAEPVMLTDANFEYQVEKSPVPVLMFSWAPWCPTCSASIPVIDEFAREARGRIRVGKLNVDPNPATANRFNIMGVPFIHVFDRGRLRESFPGGMQKHELMMKMTPYI